MDQSTERKGIKRRTLVAGTAWAVPAVTIAAPAMAFSLSGPVQATGCAEKLQGSSCQNPDYPSQAYRFYFTLTNPPGKKACIVITGVKVDTDADGNGGTTLTDPRIDVKAADVGNVCASSCCGGTVRNSLCTNPTTVTRFSVTAAGSGSSGNTRMAVTYQVYDADRCQDGFQTFTAVTPALSTPQTNKPCTPYQAGNGCENA